LDLLRENPPKHFEKGSHSAEGYVQRLREKLGTIHRGVRKYRLNIKSSRVKAWYDKESGKLFLKKGRKFGCGILEEKKGRLRNCKTIGRVPI